MEKYTPQSQIDFLLGALADRDLVLFGRKMGSTARVHLAISLRKLEAFKRLSTSK